MPGTQAARRYAKALFSLAKEQGIEKILGEQLSLAAQALAAPELARVLSLPTLPVRTRKDIVQQLISALSPHPLLGNFFRTLADNDRLNMLSDIQHAYQTMLEQALGQVRARIQTAAPLSDEELQSVVAAFSRLTAKTVIPSVEVQPELLGGVVVEIQGQVYDASVKTQLRRMGEALAQQL